MSQSRYATKAAEDRAAQSRSAASRARNAALVRLREAHREEYDALYDEEATKRGLPKRLPRRSRTEEDA